MDRPEMFRMPPPEFYDRSTHPNLDLTAKDSEGNTLKDVNKEPFTIGHVPADRRWAFDPDGRLLPQHEFKARFERLHELQLDPSALGDEEMQFIYIPNAKDYVSRYKDPLQAYATVPLHFDPYKNWDREKNMPIDQAKKQAEEKDRAAVRDFLLKELSKGRITQSEFSNRMLELEGQDVTEPKDTSGVLTAPCGAEVKYDSLRQKGPASSTHKRTCPTCKAKDA